MAIKHLFLICAKRNEKEKTVPCWIHYPVAPDESAIVIPTVASIVTHCYFASYNHLTMLVQNTILQMSLAQVQW